MARARFEKCWLCWPNIVENVIFVFFHSMLTLFFPLFAISLASFYRSTVDTGFVSPP